MPCLHAPLDGICTAWVPASQIHQMPFVVATYRVHLSMMQLLLPLSSHTLGFNSMSCPHIMFHASTGPGHCRRTRKISGDPFSPNAVRYQDLPDAVVSMIQLLLAYKAHRLLRSILRHAQMLPWTAFAQHWRRGLRGGDPGNLRRPTSPNALRCCYVPGVSVDDPAAFGHKAPRPPTFNFPPCPYAPRNSICTAWAPGILGYPKHLRGPSFTNCRPLPRRTGCFRRLSSCFWPQGSQVPRAQSSRPCPRMLPGTAFERHWRRRYRGDREIPSNPVSPNAVRCRDLPGTSVDYPVAFAREGPGDFEWGGGGADPGNLQGPSFTRCRPLRDIPSASINDKAAFGPKAQFSRHARMLPGMAIAWHGPSGFLEDPGNLR